MIHKNQQIVSIELPAGATVLSKLWRVEKYSMESAEPQSGVACILIEELFNDSVACFGTRRVS